MVNTAVLASSSPNHVTYLLTGDGTVIGPTIASSVLLADMQPGPLRNAWANAIYADQDARRTALLGGGANCESNIQMLVTVNDVTAEVNQVAADVDVDGVTAALTELNLGMSDTTGQIAMLTLKHRHSLSQ